MRRDVAGVETETFSQIDTIDLGWGGIVGNEIINEPLDVRGSGDDPFPKNTYINKEKQYPPSGTEGESANVKEIGVEGVI